MAGRTIIISGEELMFTLFHLAGLNSHDEDISLDSQSESIERNHAPLSITLIAKDIIDMDDLSGSQGKTGWNLNSNLQKPGNSSSFLLSFCTGHWAAGGIRNDFYHPQA